MIETNFTGVPEGMSVSRFLYMSQNVDRKPIPASAFAPFYYASHGYAVITPDYAGQGTDIPGDFQYEAGFLHAADVAYYLVAARKMIGHLLSGEWAVLGNVVSVYLLQSLSKVYSEAFKLSDYLTDEAMKLLPLVDQACVITGIAVFKNLTTAQIYKNTSWISSSEFQDDWLTGYNGAGPHALAAPMLVVQGRGDTLTYPENCEADFDRTCDTFPQSSAEQFLVPELGHDPAFRAATPYYWPWVERLFAGTPPPTGCKKTETKPVNERFKRGLAG
ncbi:hypothetical protein PG988_012770 [Apiospora saccharicola]